MAETETAEIKVGTSIEKYEVGGASDNFTIPPETKLYAGLKVSGVVDANVTVVFFKAGAEVNRIALKMPRTPYRSHAYTVVHAGGSGDWTVKALGPNGNEIGSAAFKVTVTG
jgi:hypothetical protein